MSSSCPPLARHDWPLVLGLLCLSCGRLGYELRPGPSDRRESDGGTSPGDASLGAGGGKNSGGAVAAGGGGGVASSTGEDAASRGGVGAGGVAFRPDASVPNGSGGQAAIDAGSDARDGAGPALDGGGYPSCSVARRWAFAFDSDPTLHDGDGDGVDDWVIRGGSPFPVSELAAGVWHATPGKALDSRPLDDFSGRTLVDIRLRSLTVPLAHRGAVFWVNVNEGAAAFSALFVSVVLQPAGGQELTLFGKASNNTETPLAVFPDLPEDFVDLHLDIEPSSRTVALWIDGAFRNTYSFPLTGVPNGDRFATLVSWEGVSEFDAVNVRTCVP